jgi:hypothetical protein
MKTITIIEGITLTATQSTIDAFRAEVARAEARRQEAAKRAKLAAWLRDPANFADPLYSDIYKDVHGVRPRW